MNPALRAGIVGVFTDSRGIYEFRVKLLVVRGMWGKGYITRLGNGNGCLNIGLTEKSYKRINC